MYKNSIIILASLIIIFLSGLTTGLLTSKNKYQILYAEFKDKVVEIEQQVRQTDFINKKLKITFETVGNRNTELTSKSGLIQEKELEIAHLTQEIAHEPDPAEKARLKQILQQKRIELDELHTNYTKKQDELDSVQTEITEVSKLLKTKSDKIVDLEQQLKKNENISHEKKELILKEKEKVQEQLDYYELACNAEAKADSIRWLSNRWEKEEAYIKAFNYFVKAEAVYNLKRISKKIKTRKLRKEMDDQIKNIEEKQSEY